MGQFCLVALWRGFLMLSIQLTMLLTMTHWVRMRRMSELFKVMALAGRGSVFKKHKIIKFNQNNLLNHKIMKIVALFGDNPDQEE